jgi:uncharacterized protein YutE (UPF0331/DUF86 family)
VVDDVRVARLLRSLTDDLSVLRGEAGAPASRRADPMWLRGVKYAFVTGIEALVDVAQHLCASEGWGPPQDNGDAVRLLGAHGVLEPGLADGLRRAVGFRNVLVHEYVRVDDDVVLARLADLTELRDFVDQVSGWLKTG